MTEKDTVFKGKLKQSGIFDFKELYRFCYDWFVDEDYFLTEKSYSEKVGGPLGKEIEIQWIAFKRISDYFRFQVKTFWRIVGLNDVEVTENGKKISMNKGTVEIKVSATLEKDWENRWETNPVTKFLRGVYDRYIIRARIEQYEIKVFADVDEFIAQAKAFLAIEGKKR